MSPEERQLLKDLFDRIQNAGASPRDKEAEAFINDAVKALPFAPYLLAQTTIVQDQALRAANDRLQELEAKVRELEARAAAPQPPQSGGFLGGLGSLFGGGAPTQQPAPSPGWRQPPQQGGWQPPQQNYGQPQPGPWGPPQGGGFGGPMGGPMGGQGGGFLKGALGAAAGVAGGVLLADSIKGLFGGHNNPLGIGAGVPGVDPALAGLGGNRETIVNNYYGDDAVRQADAQQDADQDQDDLQDAADYGSDDSGDDGSYDA